MTFHTRRTGQAKGSAPNAKIGASKPSISIRLEREMFDRVSGEAARRRLPFATIVRERLIQAYREEAS